MNNRDMIYICLEGVKGSGKTTLFKKICQSLKLSKIECQNLCPTHELNYLHPIEYLWKKIGILRKFDCLNEYIYALRSNNAARLIDAGKKIIFGDRSKLTSYAIRWKKWGNSINSIRNVDRRESSIPLPTHVIFLDVDLNIICDRLKKRKNIGVSADESIGRLKMIRENYFEIFNSEIVTNNKIIVYILKIDDETPVEIIEEKVLSIIYDIIKIGEA